MLINQYHNSLIPGSKFKIDSRQRYRLIPWQHKTTLILSKVTINSKILQILGDVYFVISEK